MKMQDEILESSDAATEADDLEGLVKDLEDAYGEVRILNINIRGEYLKIQRKRVEGSQQRIEDGLVYFTVFSFMQIADVRTFVQRYTDWADEVAFNKLENGWSELYTKMVRQKMANYEYVSDLDSVYKNTQEDNVYRLFKNKGNSLKNSFLFFVMVELVDGTVRPFCWPFYLKTKPVKK